MFVFLTFQDCPLIQPHCAVAPAARWFVRYCTKTPATEADKTLYVTKKHTTAFDFEWLDIEKIDEALAKIKDRTNGYFEETEEPIGLKRLEARPIAAYCLEVQELHEKIERRIKSKHY